MSDGLLPEVLAVFASLLLPGMGLCIASRLTVGRSFLTAIALAFGLGFGGVGLGSLLLVLLGIFGPITLAVLWIVLSAAGWLLAVRRGSLREHMDGWRSDIRADPLSTLGALSVIVGVAVIRWTVAPVANLAPTALRYWADALEIADAGRIPQGTLQWGRVIEPTTSKEVLNAFNAGASLLLGRDPIEPAGVLLYVVSIGLVTIAIAMFRELGLVRLAPLGAILLFANVVTGSELTTDLWFNLAEDWGRLVALSGVLAAIVVFIGPHGDANVPLSDPAGRPWFHVVVPGVLLGTAAGTHLVAASAAIAMVFALALALAVAWRRPRPFLLRGGRVVGISVVVGMIVLLVPRGDLGFEGAGGSDRYRGLPSNLELPPNFDPTRYIVTHDVDAASAPRAQIGVVDVGEQFAYRAIGRRAPNERNEAEELPVAFLIGPTLVALLLLLAAARWAPRHLLTTMFWATLFAVILFLVGLAFALRYELFVLEVFGDRRLFTYALIPFVVILIAGGEWALRAFEGKSGARTRAVSVAALTIVVVSGLFFLPRATWVRADDRGKLENQLELLRWVRDHVPCEGRILANRRTLGTFASIAGRAAVLEGMGPHIRPSVLILAIEEIARARLFFQDPRGRSHYLEEHGVAAVIVALSGNPFGGYPALGGAVRPRQLADLDMLREAFHNPSGTVYLVDGFRANPSVPRVSGRPGFGC